METNNKIIDRIRKLQEIANRGISNLQNVSKEMAEVYTNEANAAKAMADKLLAKYSLSNFDIQTPQERIEFEVLNRVGKSILSNNFIRANARSKRCNWFEELAKVVAENNSCKIGIENDGQCAVYGFSLDRDVFSLIFSQLSKVADKICSIEMTAAKKAVGTTSFDFKTKKTREHLKEWISDNNFIESFHAGFREEVIKSFESVENEISIEVEEYYQKSSYYSFYHGISPDLEVIDEYSREIGQNAAIRFFERKQTQVSNLSTSEKQSLVLKKKKVVNFGVGGVILAIDCSSSMDWGNDKMGQAKKGAIDFAEKAKEQSFAIGLIKFDNSASVLVEPTLEINGNFKSAIERLNASGGTNMTDAISEAMNQFVHRNNKRVLVIITDGQPNNSTETLKIADMAKAMGIEIRTVGTDDADEEFLRKLASNPNLALKVGSIGEEFQLGIGRMALRLTEGSIKL